MVENKLFLMKKVITLLFVLFLSFSIWAIDAYLGVDMMSLDSLNGPLALRGEGGVVVDDNFRFSLSFGYYKRIGTDISLSAFRAALAADCFLLGNSGLYAGVNVLDLSYLSGYDAPSGNPFAMTQVHLGYLYRYKNHFQLDARFTMNDPVNVSESDSRLLANCFKQYSKYYFALVISYRFSLPWFFKED